MRKDLHNILMDKIIAILLLLLFFVHSSLLVAQNTKCSQQVWNNREIKSATEIELSIYNNEIARCSKNRISDETNDGNSGTISEQDNDRNYRYYDRKTGEEVDEPEGTDDGISPIDMSCEQKANYYLKDHMAGLKTANEVNISNGCNISMLIISSSSGLSISYFDRTESNEAWESWLQEIKNHQIMNKKEMAIHSANIFNWIEAIQNSEGRIENEEANNEPVKSTDKQEKSQNDRNEVGNEDTKFKESINLARDRFIKTENETRENLDDEIVNIMTTQDGNVLLIDTNNDNIPDQRVTINKDGSNSYESIDDYVEYICSSEDGYFLESEMQDDGSEIISYDNNNDGVADSKIHYRKDGTVGESDPNSLYEDDVDQYGSENNSSISTQKNHTSTSSNKDDLSQGSIESTDELQIIDDNHSTREKSSVESSLINPMVEVAESFDYDFGTTEIPMVGNVKNSTLIKGRALLADPIEAGIRTLRNPSNVQAKLDLMGCSFGSVGDYAGIPNSGIIQRIPTFQNDVYQKTFDRFDNTLYGSSNSNLNYSDDIFKWLTGIDISLEFGDFSMSRWQLMQKYGWLTGIAKYDLIKGY